MTIAAYNPRHIPEGLTELSSLALDLRWSWHHGSDSLWRAIDEETWKATHNAWLVLNSVSGEWLDTLSNDETFLALYQRQVEAHRQFERTSTWYSDEYQGRLDKGVAFFCMEYGLSESLPLYSGGLGVLAGDYLKAASDLGVPVTAVGLLYQQGYFRQSVTAEGQQLEFYPYNDPSMLPLTPLTNDDEQWVRVIIPFPGRQVRLRAWKARVGHCDLLLLDSNDPRNEPGDRGITSELYSSNSEKRLQQEIVLGIGGWKLLRQLEITPSICHINEGHCAFALLERALDWQNEHATDFETARLATRATNLFTTHTSVAAGFDHFPPGLIRLYLTPWMNEYGFTMDQLMGLGSSSGEHSLRAGDEASINMALLALNMCGRINGVSNMHRKVTQTLLQPFFPRWPACDIPVESVTNGIHTPSWDSLESDALWTKACGQERWRRPLPSSCPLSDIPDSDLLSMRQAQRRRLVHYLRQRLASQHCEHTPGNNPDAACGLLLDNETLTLGFARRFTEYKRPDLLLSDPDRLLALLNNRDHPLQIVLAGKAHPKDECGKDLIRRWKAFSWLPGAEGKVVFIEDYDLGVAAQLIQGVDVWLNCPRHPWEACGTSGMKVLVNGGLNLSQYDGWWAEAWNDSVGWAIRPGATFEELSTSNSHDHSDALELYELLEKEIIPEFYQLDANGHPGRWIERIRSSMNGLTATYSANRMVREYVESFYLPMVELGNRRNPTSARDMVETYRDVSQMWRRLRFTSVEARQSNDEQTFFVDVYLDGIPEQLVAVELVAEASEFGPRETHMMTMNHPQVGSEHGYSYECSVPARPEGHYTPRIRLRDERLNLPLENTAVLWRN
ncbi:alpha-glucan family phosphorylase [Marinobacter sp. M216]|uniref:Alpha-glucan family phosphorylase n=1 Tax=Marinobacter albus TaxID=3030833 RepID=A0ABT7HBY8_9GAMM|nr:MULTISPECIES: alpha-glucan family phosphorylase [unclassified Marinobacter]MBW7469861.1 alpha-glucan family phosphorylase [Marinobacter sp. F4218]MDK9557879.1 alpha-glucan family phosphorylase [Marinobacter sp. M216]